jgi:hypothetical protein
MNKIMLQINYIKITKIVCLTLIFQNVINAQLYYGVKLGVSPSTYTITEDFTYNIQPIPFNFLAGISVEYPIYYGFSVQLDAQYTQRRGNFKSTFERRAMAGGTFFSDFLTDNDVNSNDNGQSEEGERFFIPDLYDNYRLTAGYLENHLMLKYEFMGGDRGYYIQAGPFFSIGLHANMQRKLSDKNGSFENTNVTMIRADGRRTSNFNALLSSYDTNNLLRLETNPFNERESVFDMSSTDFGLAFGGGMYKELSSGRLYFDARFLLGSQNLLKDEDFNKLRSMALQLSVMYMFTFD